MSEKPTKEQLKKLEIQVICDKIARLRMLNMIADKDPTAGLNLLSEVIPFLREHGMRVQKLLKGEA